MRVLLVAAYFLLFYLCSLNTFAGVDFVLTIFLNSSCCIFLALLARHVDGIFSDMFIMLQAMALVVYFLMAGSYVYFNAALMLELEVINNYLLIADIIALIGVLLGDSWLNNRAG